MYCRVARGEFVFDDPTEAEEFVEKVREICDVMGATYHFMTLRPVSAWILVSRLSRRAR